VRQLADGGWMKMYQATWLSFGNKKISKQLAMRFARKTRETIAMYITGLGAGRSLRKLLSAAF
jgi:hypothetical protein